MTGVILVIVAASVAIAAVAGVLAVKICARVTEQNIKESEERIREMERKMFKR